jgi:choline dehydrogenase-like flavoprotein
MSSPRVVIVGSGPIGASYAREILEGHPTAEVLMLELGPQLTEVPGVSVKNIANDEARALARTLSQGPQADDVTRAKLGLPYLQEGTLTARQGTHLIDFGGTGSGHQVGMPMASVSTNVGGQGSHWTCATPRPEDSERVDFIEEGDWERAITRAEELLKVNKSPFTKSRVGKALRDRLREEFADVFRAERQPNFLPVAAIEREDGTMIWGGTDFVFGPLIDSSNPLSKRFTLRPLSLVTKVRIEDGKATGVDYQDAVTGEQFFASADAVIVAADAMRTPQLLWNSGVRPEALGRYLTEHPVMFSVIALDPSKFGGKLTDEDLATERELGALSPSDPISAVTRVAFQEPNHPFSAQLMFVTKTPMPLPDDSPFKNNPAGYVMAGWGGRKYPRPEDRVWFDDNELDYRGLPNINIKFELTQRELDEMEQARGFLHRAADALGAFIPGVGEPRLMPSGTSLHYMGTHRIGAQDDGTSVCDSFSRVWGVKGLLTGGNGCIPTANSMNPTLTSVAIAVRGARALVASL